MPEDEDRLRTLVEAERALTVVAKELKRTEAAVAGRAYKVGIKFGKPKSRGLKSRSADIAVKLGLPDSPIHETAAES
jgi:hypothetical protein